MTTVLALLLAYGLTWLVMWGFFALIAFAISGADPYPFKTKEERLRMITKVSGALALLPMILTIVYLIFR